MMENAFLNNMFISFSWSQSVSQQQWMIWIWLDPSWQQRHQQCFCCNIKQAKEQWTDDHICIWTSTKMAFPVEWWHVLTVNTGCKKWQQMNLHWVQRMCQCFNGAFLSRNSLHSLMIKSTMSRGLASLKFKLPVLCNQKTAWVQVHELFVKWPMKEKKWQKLSETPRLLWLSMCQWKAQFHHVKDQKWTEQVAEQKWMKTLLKECLPWNSVAVIQHGLWGAKDCHNLHPTSSNAATVVSVFLSSIELFSTCLVSMCWKKSFVKFLPIQLVAVDMHCTITIQSQITEAQSFCFLASVERGLQPW